MKAMRRPAKSHNRPKPPIEVELAPGYTIQTYVELKKRRDRVGIADLILRRFDHRFFRPLGFDLVEGQWHKRRESNGRMAVPSGWLMVSIGCLAIESLMNFVNGTVRVESASKEFTAFFQNNPEFSALSKAFPVFKRKREGENVEDNKFYSDIRCGLLHQGETNGGWRLLLGTERGEMVDDSPGMRCIYARPIFAGVGQAIRRYCDGLATDEDFTTAAGSQWRRALRKLDAISEMCGVEHNVLGNPILRRRAGKAPPEAVG